MSTHRRTAQQPDEPRGHRAPRGPRLRIALAGGVVLAVVGGGTAFACLGHPGGGTQSSARPHAAGKAAWHLAAPQTTKAAPKPRPRNSHTSHKPAHPRPTPTKPTASATPKPAPTTHTPAPKPTATPAPSSPSSSADYAVQQVLNLINKARAEQNLPPYALLDGLTRSAGDHNKLMAAGCGMSHQCPGEPPIGDRETADGVHWSSAGENIGFAGPVDNTTAAIAATAVSLTQSMLDEKPPEDGHRQNILSSGFRYIGIAVLRDSKGSVWLTHDFASLQ